LDGPKLIGNRAHERPVTRNQVWASSQDSRNQLAARTAEIKEVDALVDTKTTDDKAAAVALAIALLVVKAADDS
jgi:hypothetical protein